MITKSLRPNLRVILFLSAILGSVIFFQQLFRVRAVVNDSDCAGLYGVPCSQLLRISDANIRAKYDHFSYITGLVRPDQNCTVCNYYNLSPGEYLLNLLSNIRTQSWNNQPRFIQGDQATLAEMLNMLNGGDLNQGHQTLGAQFWFNWDQGAGFTTTYGNGSFAYIPDQKFLTDWSTGGRVANNCPLWWQGGWGAAVCPAPSGTGLSLNTSGSFAGGMDAILGCVQTPDLVVDQTGTVYLIANNEKRAFTSAAVFLVDGYRFGDVRAAVAVDLALSAGPAMTFRDGTLLMGPASPTVYLVTGGQKRGFASAAVFLGLGYSFNNVIATTGADLARLADGAVITSVGTAHPAGTLVLDNGTVYEITAAGRRGFPTAQSFLAAGHNFSAVAPANGADQTLPLDATAPSPLRQCVSANSTTVSLISPQSGEQWTINSAQTIKWSDAAPAGQRYVIFVVNQGQKTLGQIAQVTGATQLSWQVGRLADGSLLAPGSGYLIIITKYTPAGVVSSQSQNSFSIVGATP